MTWVTMQDAPKDGSRVLLYARSTLDPDHRYAFVVDRWDTETCSSGKLGPTM